LLPRCSGMDAGPLVEFESLSLTCFGVGPLSALIFLGIRLTEFDAILDAAALPLSARARLTVCHPDSCNRGRRADCGFISLRRPGGNARQNLPGWLIGTRRQAARPAGTLAGDAINILGERRQRNANNGAFSSDQFDALMEVARVGPAGGRPQRACAACLGEPNHACCRMV
jgi:hypothetical protein